MSFFSNAPHRRRLYHLVALCWLGLVAGCTVPTVDGVLDRPAQGPQTVVGARGPLSPAQSKAVLARLDAHSDLLQRHLAIEQEVSDAPLAIGNHTHLLHDGPETFRAMFAAIKAAKRSIYLEYFIFENIESDGVHLIDLLAAKQRAGVSVAILYDSFGSIDTPPEMFETLRATGIPILEFHPLNPLKAQNGYSPNDRDHRKILVVDGRTAIVGGVNLYTAYQPHPHARLVASDGPDPDTWHDTDIEIDGTAAAELQQVFLTHWAAEQGPALPPVAAPAPLVAGDEAVRVIASDHSDAIPRYYATLLSAIRNAEKTIWITTAYFVPTDEELRDLTDAAARGVDVRLMLPGKSDSNLALAVGHSDYGALLKAGVKIFEMQDGMLHSKSAVIDGVWSVVGSSNFDHRSILFNDEVDAVVLGRDTARQLEALFEKEEATNARPVTLDVWNDRPFGEKIRELYARAVEAML
jgi:cardiolipin synthase